MSALLRRTKQKRPAAGALDDEHVGTLGVRNAVRQRLRCVHYQVPLQADPSRWKPCRSGKDRPEQPGRGHPIAAPNAVALHVLTSVHKLSEQVVQVANVRMRRLDFVRILGENGTVLVVQHLQPADVD